MQFRRGEDEAGVSFQNAHAPVVRTFHPCQADLGHPAAPEAPHKGALEIAADANPALTAQQ